jgi:glycine/D-amino acid oxidase-like deaminating enzyme
MATQHRDLRTGRTYWQSRRMPRVATMRLSPATWKPTSVIGAGISGALMAEALSATHRIAVVDRRGQSWLDAASTALVEQDRHAAHGARRQDRPGAGRRAWRRSALAVQALAARTGDLGIAADLRRTDNLYLAGDVARCRRAPERSERAAMPASRRSILDRRTLKHRFGIARAAALLAHDDFALDPRKLTAGYLNVAIGRGARVFTPAEVVEVVTSKSGVMAVTRDGPTIRAAKLVFATGYEMPKWVPQGRHQVISTYVIATRPQPRKLWPEDCMIWEASDPYLYMRSTPDGRVICGGEDEDFADDEKRDALIPGKSATLARKLKRLMPQLDTTPDFAWAGAFGSTATGLPSIGAVPGMPNCYAVLGFGGNGITYSRIAADIISADIAGRPTRTPTSTAFRSRARHR